MIVYTGGTFDLLHPGHVHLLDQCRRWAGRNGRVIVSLNTDDFVRQYKGITPTHSFESRKMMLEALRTVDLVVKNVGGHDSRPAVEAIMPDIIAIGEDWKDKNYHAQMGFDDKWLREREIQIVYIAHLGNFSSTSVRTSLAK